MKRRGFTNDPKRRCNLFRGFMEEKGIHMMDWPACSLGSNPIEKLWPWIKREIELKSPRNLNELERELKNGILLNMNFYNHFGHRCQKESIYYGKVMKIALIIKHGEFLIVKGFK